MKYYGKEKCRILKEIRAEIAKANDIEWVVSECKHQGNCKGTCPKCEQEVRQLEAALARREALGKSVAVVGISASIALSVTGCINPFPQTTAGEPLPPPPGGMPGPEETYVAVGGEMVPETEIVLDGVPMVPETTEDTSEETAEETYEDLMGEPALEGEYVEGETTDEETDASSEVETYEALMGDMPVE